MPAPRGLVQQFDQFLHRSRLLAPGQRLLIACSGGADSVALLRLMHAVNQSNYWGWTLRVGHVNHGLRGRASKGDQRFVERMAKQLGLACTSKMLRWDKRGGHVSEAAARAARLEALEQFARRHRCDAILLAHHADDQAETVLMRIMRGCSVAGLGAMRPRRKAGGTWLVRPLLGFEGGRLRQYLRELGQGWREDHTNALPGFLRNRIRLELMPMLEGYQPAIRRLLVRLAGQARQSERAHRQVAMRVMRQALKITEPIPARRDAGRRGKAMILSRDALKKQPAVIVGMVLRQVIGALGGDLGRLTAQGLGQAVAAVQGGRTGQEIQVGAFTVHVGREEAIVRRTVKGRGRRQARRADTLGSRGR
jgi:tRNA(Ile)-lysidine synthetase-like protein